MNPAHPVRSARWSVAVLLALAVSVAGCRSESLAPAAPDATPVAAPTHEHHPPHGGTLVELGEEFAHLELVLDPGSGKLTGYVLDGEAEKPIRLSQPSIDLEIRLGPGKSLALRRLQAQASALTGEKIGDTSEFSATSTDLIHRDHFEGFVTQIQVKGETFKHVDFSFPEGNEKKKGNP